MTRMKFAGQCTEGVRTTSRADLSNELANRFFFFFNDTATTEIYTLSLHDALPIYRVRRHRVGHGAVLQLVRSQPTHGRRHLVPVPLRRAGRDRKSTRLNSSHDQISYAVFCLKKKAPMPA